MAKPDGKIRVGIVDDSPLMRRMIGEAINSSGDMEVGGEAANPHEAREMIKATNVDVITLDVEMPKMNGLDFLEKLMRLRPMPVIMVSTLTHDGAETTLRALELGAIDYVGKPLGRTESFGEFRDEIVAKIRAAMGAHFSSVAAEPVVARPEIKVPRFTLGKALKDVSLIAIGASTGGVERLRRIFEQLPGNLPPIVIVQHMTAQFVPNFANRLASLSKVKVCVPMHDQLLQPGHAYIAGNTAHLHVKGNHPGPYRARLVDGPNVSGHKASIDVMFQSVAQQVGPHVLGIILTGMGADGANGMKEMFDKGAYTIGESEQSALIYGMPRCAKERGGVCEEMTISEITAKISTLAGRS